jgi:hypothetical protein
MLTGTLYTISSSNSIVPFLLMYRFMQQLEDALNVALCGQFLILLAAICFAAFSLVTVQYDSFGECNMKI